MPDRYRTGQMVKGLKARRCLERCTGNNAQKYTKSSSAGVGRTSGNKNGCKLRMSDSAGHNFRSKRASGLESSEESGESIHYGYYPVTYQERAESEAELFERKINFLKQELEIIYRKLKTRRLPESGGEE